MKKNKNTEILRDLLEILWYIDEYNKGNEMAYDALYELAESLKDTMIGRRLHAKLVEFLLSVEKLKVKFVNSSTMNDPTYQELMQMSEEDLAYFRAITDMLKPYLKYCIREEEFENLGEAYMLYVQSYQLLGNILEYCKCINTLLQSQQNGITYNYPLDIISNRDTLDTELQSIKKQLTYPESKEN